MSHEAEYIANVIIDDDASDIYVLKIVEGVGRLYHGNARHKGMAEVSLTEVRLGEVMMYLRSPLLESAAEGSMGKFDNAPDPIKAMVQVYGNKPLAMWINGFDIEHIAQTFNWNLNV